MKSAIDVGLPVTYPPLPDEGPTGSPIVRVDVSGGFRRVIAGGIWSPPRPTLVPAPYYVEIECADGSKYEGHPFPDRWEWTGMPK